ncbi:putative transposase [Streptomyces sp. W007]|nr:putative transposase [Streptomyces sp. W007]
MAGRTRFSAARFAGEGPVQGLPYLTGSRKPAAGHTLELALFRVRLEEFAGEVFAPLARADQRVKGGLYLRGLLLDVDAADGGAPRWRPSAVAAVHDVVHLAGGHGSYQTCPPTSRAGTWSGRRSCGGASSTTTGS